MHSDRSAQHLSAATLLAAAWTVGLIASGCSGGGGGGGGHQASTTATAPSSTTLGITPATPATGGTQPATVLPSPTPPPTPVALPPVDPPATTPPAPTTLTTAAKLCVDTDRDGAITPADDAGRETWTSARGAVFTYNNDDDDGKHAIDCSDTILNGPNDSRSLGLIVARQYAGPAATSITVSVTPATAPVRLFMADAAATYTQFLAPGAGSAALPVSALTTSDVWFLMEATAPRSTAWNGMVTVTLTIQSAAPIAPSSDTVALCCAPLIYTDNTRPAVRVYAMMIDAPSESPNQNFWNALETGLAAQAVDLYQVNEATYGYDRWVQDNMQIGYQGYASPLGYCWLDEFNQLERGSGAGGGTPSADLWNLVPTELLAPNQGMAYAGKSAFQDSPNYGGNLEILPPYGDPAFPFGRIMHGGGDQGTVDGGSVQRHMNPEEVALLEAQGMQSPTIEISSEWLDVGHLDEFLMFVPDLSAQPTHPFKVLWSSPTLAIQALTQLQAAGQGSALVFAGQPTQTTINTIVNDTNLMTFNDEVQARLDSDKATLESITGLTDADFIDVPVFYQPIASSGLNFSVAQMPGVQNCIPVNDTLYVPDPVGPKDANGNDVWQQQFLAAVAPAGLSVVFVDVFTSYHLLEGEAHCGSNVLYKPYDAPWWTK